MHLVILKSLTRARSSTKGPRATLTNLRRFASGEYFGIDHMVITHVKGAS